MIVSDNYKSLEAARIKLHLFPSKPERDCGAKTSLSRVQRSIFVLGLVT